MTISHHNSAQPSPSLGATVRKYRERAGLSIRQLAAKAGVHYAYLSRVENGTYEKPAADVLQSVANVLNIDPAKLLRFIGVKPSTKLPGPKVYFRRAYGLTASEAQEAAARVDDIIRDLRDHQRNSNNKQSKGGIKS